MSGRRPPGIWPAPDEYGFYANVNPHVDHPRWSQASERFIGAGGVLDVKRQPTLLFNGYAEEVASLYRGLELAGEFLVRLNVKQITWLKVALHLAGFLPLVWLFWAGHQGYFSADPAKDIQHFTGTDGAEVSARHLAYYAAGALR